MRAGLGVTTDSDWGGLAWTIVEARAPAAVPCRLTGRPDKAAVSGSSPLRPTINPPGQAPTLVAVVDGMNADRMPELPGPPDGPTAVAEEGRHL
jgi:hypothetical protein